MLYLSQIKYKFVTLRTVQSILRSVCKYKCYQKSNFRSGTSIKICTKILLLVFWISFHILFSSQKVTEKVLLSRINFSFEIRKTNVLFNEKHIFSNCHSQLVLEEEEYFQLLDWKLHMLIYFDAVEVKMSLMSIKRNILSLTTYFVIHNIFFKIIILI